MVNGIVIHEGMPDADQEQPVLVAIDSVLDEPVAATDRLDGVTVKGHVGFDPLWFTVNVCPAMVRVPLRVVLAVFAETE